MPVSLTERIQLSYVKWATGPACARDRHVRTASRNASFSENALRRLKGAKETLGV